MAIKRDPLQCTRCVEFRTADGDGNDGRTLRGYAAVFNEDTVISSMFEGRFKERIDPGAFKKTLRESKPIMQWNHGNDPAVGQIPIGVYDRLEADDHGLDVEGRLHSDPVSERVREAIASGAVTGMSFKFQVIRDEWRDASGKIIRDKNKLFNLLYGDDENEMPSRTIKEVRLFEAGPVSTPAYGGTSVGVRSDMTDDDRMAVVARMLRVSDEDEADDTAQITQWLEAERSWQADASAWLEAENLHRWLEAEAQWRKDSEKPYGDVTYADPGYQKDKKKRYPLDTKDHVKSAWSYINMPKNAEAYTAGQLSSIKSKIKAAAKKFGVEITEKKSSDVDAAVRSTSSSGKRTDAAPAGTSERNSKQDNTITERVKKMKLEELKARRAAITARFTEFDAEYRDADMPEDVQTEFDSLTDEMREIDESVARIEARQAFMKGIAERGDAAQVERGSDSGVRHQSPAFHKDQGDDLYNLDELRMSARNPEDFVARATDNARKAIDKARFARVVGKDDARERVSELLDIHDDEDGTLAKRILATGSPLYERAFGKALKACSTAGLTIEEQRAMSLGTDAAGGYAVPFQLDPTVILTNDGFAGSLRNLARVETIVGKKWQGVTSAGISVSRDGSPANHNPGTSAGEIGRQVETGAGAEAADSGFDLAQPEVTAVRVQGFVPFTFELEHDWGGLRSEITRMLSDAKDREEMESFTLGDGTGTPNQPGGVVGSLPAGSRVAQAAGEAITVADIYALENALAPRWRGSAQFMANKAIYNMIRQLDTNGGAALWEHLGGGLPSKLIGYSVNENSYMDGTIDASATATNDVLLFGDFKQFLIVDSIGMTVELVPHVFGSNGRPTGQRGVYAIWRNNAKVLVPGAFRILRVTTASP